MKECTGYLVHGHSFTVAALACQLPLETVFAPSLHARKQSQGLGDWSGAGDAQSREEKQGS